MRFIERDILQKLSEWKSKPDRMPLIIKGARQIGKTWVLKSFGKSCFEHTAYFNFDKTKELSTLFEKTKDVERLTGELQFYVKTPILPEKTLLIFDEIQECNAALNSLKYFCEEKPEYAVIAAGSLLGVSMAKGDSFPVGKVEFLQMYPLSFREFLREDANDLFDFCENLKSVENLPQIVFNRLSEAYNRYLLTGGMPKVVVDFLDNKGIERLEDNLRNVLDAYSLDFAKHAEKKDIPKITEIWRSVPSQLSRENRKFIYKLVKTGARAREYEDALLWLQHAGLVYRVFANTKPALPLSAYDDLQAFKIYLSDIGLLRSLAKLPPEIILNQSPLYREFKGAMAENAVLQLLVTQFEVFPRYWTSDGKAEVDFVLQNNLKIIPIEVKSASNISGKGLSVYIKKFSPNLQIIFSTNNLKKDGNTLKIPLFLADWTKRIITIC